MHSRRSVLAGSAAVLGAAALGGCNVLDSGGGAGRSRYTDWMYEADETAVSFGYSDVSTVRSIDDLPEALYETTFAEIPVENVEFAASVQSDTVFEGTFDPDELRAGFEAELSDTFGTEVTLEADGEYAGYRRYAASGLPTEAAIAEDSAVLSIEGKLERFLDVGTGSEPSLVEDNEDADALTERMGVAHSLNGVVASSGGEPVVGEAQVGIGTTLEYGPETTEHVRYVLFETESDVDEAAVRDLVEGGQSSNVSARTDGRFVEVEYTLPTSDLVQSDGP